MKQAAVCAAVLALSFAPLARADPGEWSVKPGTTLRMTWDYTFDEKTDASKEGKCFRKETRKVTALLVCKDGFKKTGSFVFTPDTVEWTVDTEDYTVTLSKTDQAKEPKVDTAIKDPNAEGAASQEAEEMTEYAQASYRLLVRPSRKAIQVKTHNGWAGGGTAPSLFNRCYVHSDLPEDEVKSTMRWLDEREPELMPLYSEPGNFDEYPQVQLKLQLGKGVASAKGTGKANFKGLTPFNWQYAGKSDLKRSFKCDANRCSISSSEDAKSKVKREDQTEPGWMKGQMTVKQSLTIAPTE